MPFRLFLLVVLVTFSTAERGRGCSICDPNFQQRPTWRQSARSAKFVVLGTLANPRLDGEKGSTDLQVESVVLGEPALGKRKVLTLPGYIPFDPKNPPRFLVFGELADGKLLVERGSPVQKTGAVDYLRSALQIDDRDRGKILLFCYKHLDSTDTDVAADAFLELAKANDREIADLAGQLPPEKFRTLLKDPKTPADRLGIFAFLLGACGTKDDAELLAGMIRKNDERGNGALSGLLGGLIELRPQDGWPATVRILRDPKRHFSDKLAAIGTLRFFHACKPKECRKQILEGMAAVVDDGDMADMAIEDLRRWQWWDATKQVLSQYGKPSHAAPLMKRSIIRYALCCPEAEAVEFVKARRDAEPGIVKEVEESLEFEKPAKGK